MSLSSRKLLGGLPLWLRIPRPWGRELGTEHGSECRGPMDRFSSVPQIQAHLLLSNQDFPQASHLRVASLCWRTPNYSLLQSLESRCAVCCLPLFRAFLVLIRYRKHLQILCIKRLAKLLMTKTLEMTGQSFCWLFFTCPKEPTIPQITKLSFSVPNLA